jgi:RNA polymerase sigma factor (sigma-70 family)
MDRERGLMRRVARGDEAAFTELVGRYAPKLLAVARRLLGSRADAEDAVQRALLQCFQSASSYEPRWAVSTWLYRILTNICVDELRRRTVRHAYAAAPPAEAPSPFATLRISPRSLSMSWRYTGQEGGTGGARSWPRTFPSLPGTS